MEQEAIILTYARREDAHSYLCRLTSTIPLAQDVRGRKPRYSYDMKLHTGSLLESFTLTPPQRSHVDVYGGGGKAQEASVDFVATEQGIHVDTLFNEPGITFSAIEGDVA